MVEESDGIEDALEGQLRVLITAAGQVAERVTRAREDALRRTRAGSEHQARAVQSRLAAEQAAARVELGNVHRPDWLGFRGWWQHLAVWSSHAGGS